MSFIWLNTGQSSSMNKPEGLGDTLSKNKWSKKSHQLHSLNQPAVLLQLSHHFASHLAVFNGPQSILLNGTDSQWYAIAIWCFDFVMFLNIWIVFLKNLYLASYRIGPIFQTGISGIMSHEVMFRDEFVMWLKLFEKFMMFNNEML